MVNTYTKRGKNIRFKIDSGADLTDIPSTSPILKDSKILKSDKELCGPDVKTLKHTGKLIEEIQHRKKKITEGIRVIEELQSYLLTKPAILAFGLEPNFSEINAVSQAKFF